MAFRFVICYSLFVIAVMNTRTSLGLFVVTALATRLLGGGTTQEVDVRPTPPAPPPVSTPSTEFTQQLRERLKSPVTPERGRNPFVYGSRHASAPSVRRDELAEVEVAAPPPEPPAPIFKLSGIAASQQDGAAVLTAIVIDNGALVFAKAGDKLSNGHTVVRVDEMSVTLVDATGVTQTLRLP
jgi:hypothetical protein